MSTGLVYDPIFLQHVNPQGHPERVERLSAIQERLEKSGLLPQLTPVLALAADPDILTLVHEAGYVDGMLKLAGRDGYLDSDTYISEQSIAAARVAAGGTVALAEAVWKGTLRNGLALPRPPGHHAEADRAMGFCLFNNIALAAAALRKAGAARVAIYDWDVHHGNGTQHMFEADPSVLYISTHQYPFYPGTGAAAECGVGKGRGATVNIPMPAACGDAEYLDAMDTIILPILEQFKPEVLLISAGFDIDENDPLGGMAVTATGYAAMTQRMHAFAERACGGKILYVLEGGYDLEGLATGVQACAADLLHPGAPVVLPRSALKKGWEEARGLVLRVQREFWKV